MLEVIANRRSVRRFKADSPLTGEQIDQLLRAAMQAPSTGNQQPWEFIVVEKQQTKELAAKTGSYAGCCASAAAVIVLLANDNRCKYPEAAGHDMAAAAENMLLEAVNQGIGAVWLGVAPVNEREQHLRKIFNLPKYIRPFALIALGHPDADDANHFKERYDAARIHFENYT